MTLTKWLAAGLVVAAALTIALPARAEPMRVLVAAGSNVGLAAERPLKFADNDAARVRDVMVSLGGVSADHAFLLRDATRASLFAAIDRAKTAAQKHRADEVTLVFYFSGHGDRDAIHLDGDRVAMADISAKLGEVPASLRIAVTDACRATRDKGFAPDEPFAISPALVPQATGQVWLHASSDGEAAQESDELQGAIFTHAWLNGLRGAADSNGDARVTLDESFAFAHSQTLIRSAKSSGVVQKPEAVVNLHEHAPVVLTQTVAHVGTLGLPRGADAHFLVYSADAKSVLSELWGSPDRALLLRVPPGRYVVQRRLGGAGGAAKIALAEGETRSLDEHDFSATPLDALAQKGAGEGESDAGDPARPQREPEPDRVDSRPRERREHELALGWDLGGNGRTGFVHGPRGDWAYSWRNVAIGAGVAAEFTGRALPDSEESLAGAFARASIQGRWALGRIVVHAGAGARGGVVWQTITPKLVDPPSKRSGFELGPEIALGARIKVTGPWFVDLTATGALPFLRESEALHAIPVLTGGLLVGLAF